MRETETFRVELPFKEKKRDSLDGLRGAIVKETVNIILNCPELSKRIIALLHYLNFIYVHATLNKLDPI